VRVVCELRHTYLCLTEALQKPSAIDRAARMRDGWIASPTLIREGTAPRVISIVSAAEIMVGSQTLSSCGADLRPRLLVRGTSCAGACASRGYRGIPAEALITGSVDEVARSAVA
jgi:hypothetical protein